MKDYDRVRAMFFKEGKRIRAIARETHLHRDTVKKMIELSAPPGYRRQKEPERPVLGPFTPVIDAMLESDRSPTPKKQRHTAKRVFDRLCEEYGYGGGYTQAPEYVAKAKERKKEAFVPLEFGPAEAQVDWGESWVDHEGERLKAHMFVMTLPFSNGRFVACFPRQTLEFFLEGHRRAFEFFGGVPKRITYDNLKSAVTKVGRGRRRDLNVTFEEFANYLIIIFSIRLSVTWREATKKAMWRRAWTGRGRTFSCLSLISATGAVLGEQLAQRCGGMLLEVSRGDERTIAERLAEEREDFFPIPASPARPKTLKTWSVSKLCLVRFDRNDYSAPCQYAYQPVTLRADVGKVQIFSQDQCIAQHTRCHEREKAIYEAWRLPPIDRA